MFSRFRSLLTHRAGRARLGGRLERCPGCGHDAVHPVWWEALDEEHWWITFDRDLDRARAEIVDEAERMSLEIMSTEADAFAVALERDLIGVDDFAPGPRG